MIAATNLIGTISRKKCRDEAAYRFDVKVIAQQYLNLFTHVEIYL